MEHSHSMPIAKGSTLRMRPDRVVELTHTVSDEDTFETAAADIFKLLKVAEQLYPGGLRSLTVSIEGQKGDRAGFNADFFEFQQEFLLGTLGVFFTWIELPLTGSLGNPNAQRNDLPDRLAIGNENV